MFELAHGGPQPRISFRKTGEPRCSFLAVRPSPLRSSEDPAGSSQEREGPKESGWPRPSFPRHRARGKAIREPIRRSAAPLRPDAAGWGAFFRYIGAHARLMIGIILGSAILAMAIQGTMIWTPTYARRVLGVSPAEIGTMMSVAVALGGIVGGLSMGMLIDRQFARGTRDMALRLLSGFSLVIPPILALAFLAGDFTLLFLAVTLMMMTMGACFGPTMAAVQMIAPPEMRGRFAALTVLASNLFGYALGPMLIGLLTDYAFRDPMKIGYAIIVAMLIAGPGCAFLVWRARGDFLRLLDASSPR